VRLARTLNSGKIIATCRSGDYSRSIEGFDVAELMPLSKEEREDIVRLWCDRPQEFLREVAAKPYADLLDRPLYLCQIVLVFNEYGRFPNASKDIYRRIVILMLERWDRERGIDRKTIYASFDIEVKQDFIAHFAHDLFVRYGAHPFNYNQLASIYTSICDQF
jgi:predicted NACHT family NTPase